MELANVLPKEAAEHLARSAKVGEPGSFARVIAVNGAINWVRFRYARYFRRESSEGKDIGSGRGADSPSVRARVFRQADC